MAVRPLEVAALTPLLTQDWDSPEQLAASLIETLDKVRTDRTSYVGVMQFGDKPGSIFYAGVGPYPGRKSAENALAAHPALSEAFRYAVVPVVTDKGLKALLERTG